PHAPAGILPGAHRGGCADLAPHGIGPVEGEDLAEGGFAPSIWPRKAPELPVHAPAQVGIEEAVAGVVGLDALRPLHLRERMHLAVEERPGLAPDDGTHRVDTTLLGDLGEILVGLQRVDADLPELAGAALEQALGDLLRPAVGEDGVVLALFDGAEV